eukprot:Sspe_Gene.41985::Locus_20352_Transcript_1_1_Confidence_1.000_Length_1225::g.41985::m.41985
MSSSEEEFNIFDPPEGNQGDRKQEPTERHHLGQPPGMAEPTSEAKWVQLTKLPDDEWKERIDKYCKEYRLDCSARRHLETADRERAAKIMVGSKLSGVRNPSAVITKRLTGKKPAAAMKPRKRGSEGEPATAAFNASKAQASTERRRQLFKERREALPPFTLLLLRDMESRRVHLAPVPFKYCGLVKTAVQEYVGILPRGVATPQNSPEFVHRAKKQKLAFFAFVEFEREDEATRFLECEEPFTLSGTPVKKSRPSYYNPFPPSAVEPVIDPSCEHLLEVTGLSALGYLPNLASIFSECGKVVGVEVDSIDGRVIKALVQYEEKESAVRAQQAYDGNDYSASATSSLFDPSHTPVVSVKFVHPAP